MSQSLGQNAASSSTTPTCTNRFPDSPERSAYCGLSRALIAGGFRMVNVRRGLENQPVEITRLAASSINEGRPQETMNPETVVITILAVDDDPNDLFFMRHALTPSEFAFQLITAGNGVEGAGKAPAPHGG